MNQRVWASAPLFHIWVGELGVIVNDSGNQILLGKFHRSVALKNS
jgi:hypothetical protein